MAMYIAWDIETCPTPLKDLTEQQRTRYEKELRRELGVPPEEAGEEARTQASRLVRSVHPFLCWICCISAVRYEPRTQKWGEPKSWAFGLRRQEDDLLAQFWNDVKAFTGTPTWVTFNGKRFDVPVLRARTLAHGLRPTRIDLLNTHRYRHRPHCDLAGIFEYVSLADVCDHLGVDSPKGDLDGSGVADAVKNGRLADVAAYCEGDVVATMECYLRSKAAIVNA